MRSSKTRIYLQAYLFIAAGNVSDGKSSDKFQKYSLVSPLFRSTGLINMVSEQLSSILILVAHIFGNEVYETKINQSLVSICERSEMRKYQARRIQGSVTNRKNVRFPQTRGFDLYINYAAPVDELCWFRWYQIVACWYLNTGDVHTVTSNIEARVNTTTSGHVSLRLEQETSVRERARKGGRGRDKRGKSVVDRGETPRGHHQSRRTRASSSWRCGARAFHG